ncbi:hypothetical protein BBBOND_0313350 [Babesia bigemina]|uniref:Uncharacterized protein n=1 Tax=Babesia bigemina TaxID=5866 RepID=A0A061DA68_BABBI|nr:hypothetical protein BBBOND_0313350 [Babesia bigemina]CDR97433.1 hypothetical protein BBBOND_0313350 [Babesia bigemina]|eukprot:XP_012769619.1 hypothetical protein BBBOND_0313350 [Babesia bigemina]
MGLVSLYCMTRGCRMAAGRRGSVAWPCENRLAVTAVEGTGRGSGTCCSWLRGVGAAVVEGTGSGGKMVTGERYLDNQCNTNCNIATCSCCPWCCDKCNSRSKCSICSEINTPLRERKVCRPSGCGAGDYTCTSEACECNCCEQKRSTSRAQHRVSGQQSTTDSSPIPYIIVPVALIIVVICVMIYFRIRPFHRVRYLLRS